MSARKHTDAEADRHAVGIYAVMDREPTDALEMISECSDVRILETLHKMLTCEGSARTDKHLNAIMAGPVARRLAQVRGGR